MKYINSWWLCLLILILCVVLARLYLNDRKSRKLKATLRVSELILNLIFPGREGEALTNFREVRHLCWMFDLRIETIHSSCQSLEALARRAEKNFILYIRQCEDKLDLSIPGSERRLGRLRRELYVFRENLERGFVW